MAPKTGAITFVQRFGGLVNLNVHFHLLIPDGVFTETDTGLAFALLPPPTGRDLLAILDRVIRRVAQRLAREQPDDAMADESPPELFAQLQAEAATIWRSPATADRVRGSDGLRAWCDGFSLHAGVVAPDYDREAIERLCRYGAAPRSRMTGGRGPATAGSRTGSSGPGRMAALTWCSSRSRSWPPRPNRA